MSRLWPQPRRQLRKISTRFSQGGGGAGADPVTILQGLVTEFERQPLRRIHGLCLLGGDFEKRGVKGRNIFLDLTGTALAGHRGDRPVSGRPLTEVTAPRIVCALVFGTWVIESIDVVSVPRHLGQGRSSLGHQLPQPVWR